MFQEKYENSMPLSQLGQIGGSPNRSALDYAQSRAGDVATKENLLSINGETLKVLTECSYSLDGLISKFEGPSLKSSGNSASTPEPLRSITDDARRIRGIASQLLGRIQYLHEACGIQ